MLDVVHLQQKLDGFDETWVPKVVGELNGQYVKLAKFQGEYVWHSHEHEDEMFLVLKGTMQLHLEDGVLDVAPGSFVIVPRGVRHKPAAAELVECLLFEPAATRNTGDVTHGYTIEADDLERI